MLGDVGIEPAVVAQAVQVDQYGPELPALERTPRLIVKGQTTGTGEGSLSIRRCERGGIAHQRLTRVGESSTSQPFGSASASPTVTRRTCSDGSSVRGSRENSR